MGQPPLFQPCILRRAWVELMWVNRGCSLLNCGSVRETGKDFGFCSFIVSLYCMQLFQLYDCMKNNLHRICCQDNEHTLGITLLNDMIVNMYKMFFLPLPWVFASMISLILPAPTLFLAASLTLYQVPQRRLSSLKERSVELMNTSLHSSVLSTEYCSTKPANTNQHKVQTWVRKWWSGSNH